MRTGSYLVKLFDEVAETKISGKVNVVDYRNLVLATYSSDTTSGFTLKVRGSIEDPDKVDISDSQSKNNKWEYLRIRDLEDGDPKSGDTGYICDSDESRMFEIESNGLSVVAIEVSSYSDGKVTADLRVFNNQ